MLGKLGLPKSTYYRYAGGRNPKADRWADVRPLLREAFSRAPNGMGYRQVAMVLENELGFSISGKTALKLMREEGLRCRIRRKRCDSYRGEEGKVAKNVLDRDFTAEGPMKKLVTDVTEFKVAGGKAYLSPVMDLYNNEIVAWSVARSATMAQTMEMLDGLEPLLRGPALLHSDQGWQYQQLSFQKRLERMGLTQSMLRKATCLDNACMEGFFGHLKDEFFRGREFDSFDSFREQLDSYIVYWNTRRYQARLKGMTPVECTASHFLDTRNGRLLYAIRP